MADLIQPHGGMSEPICRTVPQEEIAEFLAGASDLDPVPVSAADVSTLYRIGDGTLSPLDGPMDRDTYERVLEECVIAHDNRLFDWTIPLSLPVTAAMAAGLSPGNTVALVNPAGDVVATLEIRDISATTFKQLEIPHDSEVQDPLNRSLLVARSTPSRAEAGRGNREAAPGSATQIRRPQRSCDAPVTSRHPLSC